MPQRAVQPHTTRLATFLSLLLVVAVLIPYLGSATLALADTHSGPLRAQSQLLQLASAQPAATVSVIVQKAGAGSSLEAMVSDLGGHVTHDLSIINGFAAEMPASAVRQLASAEQLRWVSLNSPQIETGRSGGCSQCVNTSRLQNAYIQTIGADRLWNEPPYLQGQGIGVAIVDSGITADSRELDRRLVAEVGFSATSTSASDGFGHGTHVAGIIGGNGARSSGAYIGVAPKVNLINVKVSDDIGMATASDVVQGLSWVFENKDRYNIRVVNLSLNNALPESYHTNPINAALEVLWFSGIVVVVSAGNNGVASGTLNNEILPPANDPFVITVGATNDKGTPQLNDDSLAPFSAHGTTMEGYTKPDLLAPGTNITSWLANRNAVLVREHRDHIVGRDYFRMSGTSMAAPVVAGAVALLLQDEPHLTPDQVKYRLMATAQPFKHNLEAGVLDIYSAVHGTSTEAANADVAVSDFLRPALEGVLTDTLADGADDLNWGSVNWGSVNWGSVNWGSVNWGSVNWGSVNWGSTYWGD
jgi:serine protease AprX